jgi:ubiquinone biosynthesis protein
MDLIIGIKPGSYRGPLDMHSKLASAALLTYIDTVFDAGFFHADPHAGNVLIAHDKLCFLDWGMVGRLTNTMQMHLMQIILAITQSNAEELVRVSLKAFGQNTVNKLDLLVSEVQDLLAIFHYKKDAQSLGHLLLAYINLLRQNQINIPVQYVLMCRALLAVEGLSKQIDPAINILQVIKPRIQQKLFGYFNPLAMGSSFANQLRNTIWLIQNLPQKLNHLTNLLATGQFIITHQGLSPLRHALIEAANKLALALVTGALVVGSSLVITTNTPPLIFGHSAIGLIGYLFSSIFGFMLAFNILRKGK